MRVRVRACVLVYVRACMVVEEEADIAAGLALTMICVVVHNSGTSTDKAACHGVGQASAREEKGFGHALL